MQRHQPFGNSTLFCGLIAAETTLHPLNAITHSKFKNRSNPLSNHATIYGDAIGTQSLVK
jgi:hypothetical protein